MTETTKNDRTFGPFSVQIEKGMRPQAGPLPTVANRFPKWVRMVRPGFIGIRIGETGTEYVMSVAEANDLIGMINRAKHASHAHPTWEVDYTPKRNEPGNASDG